MKNDVAVKALSFVLRLDWIFDNGTVRHQPAIEQMAIGQGDTANGDRVVRLVHLDTPL